MTNIEGITQALDLLAKIDRTKLTPAQARRFDQAETAAALLEGELLGKPDADLAGHAVAIGIAA